MATLSACCFRSLHLAPVASRCDSVASRGLRWPPVASRGARVTMILMMMMMAIMMIMMALMLTMLMMLTMMLMMMVVRPWVCVAV